MKGPELDALTDAIGEAGSLADRLIETRERVKGLVQQRDALLAAAKGAVLAIESGAVHREGGFGTGALIAAIALAEGE